jgi:hypothetical protein
VTQERLGIPGEVRGWANKKKEIRFIPVLSFSGLFFGRPFDILVALPSPCWMVGGLIGGFGGRQTGLVEAVREEK